jgi:hypothetical protein
MPEYKSFIDSSVRLRIEIEGSGGNSGSYAVDLAAALGSVAGMLGDQIANIAEGKRPSEITVSFGLRAIGGGGYAISLYEEQANFRVSLKWGGSTGDMLSDFTMPVG